jgi:hypothetical protein
LSDLTDVSEPAASRMKIGQRVRSVPLITEFVGNLRIFAILALAIVRVLFAAVPARIRRLNFLLGKYEFGEVLFQFYRGCIAAVLTTGLVAVAA